jgi:carbonic anhydrase
MLRALLPVVVGGIVATPLAGCNRNCARREATRPIAAVRLPEARTMADDLAPTLTASEALARLQEGNERFIAGHARFPTVQKEVLADLAKGQQPYATILGCSDSRVPPELVFDASFGELFVIRVAGNVLGPSILGTLQYAATHLHPPLFVVMGHAGCGAVKAAIASYFHGAGQKTRIALLLESIVPALEGLDASQPEEALLRSGVEANVRHTVQALRETPEGKARMAEGRMKLVGAVYELESGRVRFLE